MKKSKWLIGATLLLMMSCRGTKDGNLVYLQVVDRNGYTKTINEEEKIKKYEMLDLRAPSHHEKMVKLFDKGDKGVVTVYHDSGLLFEYLETKNQRAHGVYEQYDEHGNIKIRSIVIEGVADLTEQAKKTWVFDKISYVYGENKNVVASIPYANGAQQGDAEYYYPSGELKKKIPFEGGKIHGQEKWYDKLSNLILVVNYVRGEKDGEAFYKGSSEEGAYEEVYNKGRILYGKYYDIEGALIYEIKSGDGKKPLYKEGKVGSVEEYKNGVLEGLVQLYNDKGCLTSSYEIKNGKKHGKEIFYYNTQVEADGVKKLLITWKEGVIHGKVVSWYPNGVMESEKEMSDHKREGTQICWYLDNSIMMVEEYQGDKLLNGKYYRKGDSVPISRVIDGVGSAHIYDKDGILMRKISYYNGNPVE